jgi:hypothetical protein
VLRERLRNGSGALSPWTSKSFAVPFVGRAKVLHSFDRLLAAKEFKLGPIMDFRWVDEKTAGDGDGHMFTRLKKDVFNIKQASEPFSPKKHGPLAYFEVRIDAMSTDGLYVGLAPKDCQMLPGWESGSVGLDGCTGMLHEGSSQGRAWATIWKQADIIGCGLDFRTKEIFFCRNGNCIGIAQADVDLAANVYVPTVGFNRAAPSTQITCRFGVACGDKGKHFEDGGFEVSREAARLLCNNSCMCVMMRRPILKQCAIQSWLKRHIRTATTCTWRCSYTFLTPRR